MATTDPTRNIEEVKQPPPKPCFANGFTDSIDLIRGDSRTWPKFVDQGPRIDVSLTILRSNGKRFKLTRSTHYALPCDGEFEDEMIRRTFGEFWQTYCSNYAVRYIFRDEGSRTFIELDECIIITFTVEKKVNSSEGDSYV